MMGSLLLLTSVQRECHKDSLLLLVQLYHLLLTLSYLIQPLIPRARIDEHKGGVALVR